MYRQRLLSLFLSLLFWLPGYSQAIEVTGSRNAVRTTGDIIAIAIPVACGITTYALKDWDGMKQGVLAGASSVGVVAVLKLVIDKERPDKSNYNSFPSMHSAISFTGAAFIQKRYGWKWGIPAYTAASFVGWSRVYGKKHDWWDVATGATLGIASAYIFTQPFAEKYNFSLAPSAGSRHIGIHASIQF